MTGGPISTPPITISTMGCFLYPVLSLTLWTIPTMASTSPVMNVIANITKKNKNQSMNIEANAILSPPIRIRSSWYNP